MVDPEDIFMAIIIFNKLCLLISLHYSNVEYTYIQRLILDEIVKQNIVKFAIFLE